MAYGQQQIDENKAEECWAYLELRRQFGMGSNPRAEECLDTVARWLPYREPSRTKYTRPASVCAALDPQGIEKPECKNWQERLTDQDLDILRRYFPDRIPSADKNTQETIGK